MNWIKDIQLPDGAKGASQLTVLGPAGPGGPGGQQPGAIPFSAKSLQSGTVPLGASPGGAPNFSDLAGQNLEQMGIQPPPNDAPQEPVQQAPTVVAKPVRIPSKHRPDTPPTDLPSPKYPTLVEAAMAGDVADVENHILRGEDLDGRNARGYTALHCAAESGYLPVLELLLDYGVKLDLDADPNTYSPPVIIAMKAGQFEAATLLREFGATHTTESAVVYGDLAALKEIVGVNSSAASTQNAMKRTLLHIAAFFGHKDVAEYLLDLGLDPAQGDVEGNSALFLAAIYNHPDVVKLFVDRGASLDQRIFVTGETILHIKAQTGDTELVDFLLSLGADINAKRKDGFTPLHVAAQAGKKDMAKLLIESGAVIYSTDNKGRTPLHIAAEAGLADMEALLLDNGAAIERGDKLGSTALHIAAREAHKDAVALLLEREADVNSKNKRGETPLHMAVMEDRSKPRHIWNQNPIQKTEPEPNPERSAVVELLIEKGALIEGKTKYGTTPLHVAAAAGQDYLVNLLLDKGADIEALDNNNRTPLFSAFEKDKSRTVKALLARNANINAKDNVGRIPLHVAAQAMHQDLVEMLLAKGTDVNMADANQWTPLHSAAEKGSLGIAELLLAHGANATAADIAQRTPLHVAAQRGDVQLAKLFVANGANVNAKDRNGRTPIHAAAWEGHWGPVQVFIGEGADINVADANGFTPLHIAAEQGHTRMVKLLMSRGANVNLRNSEARTPLRIAEDAENKEVAALLRPATESAFNTALQSGDVVNVKRFLDDCPDLANMREQGLSPLHIVSRDGRCAIVEMLLGHGADIAAAEKNFEGMTAMHEAAMNGHKDIVELLLVLGADINASDRRGKTPLDRAMSKNRAEVIDFLKSKGAKSNLGVLRGAITDVDKKQADEEKSGRVHARMNNALMSYVFANNLAEAQRVLDEHPGVVNVLYLGKTPLFLACTLGFTDMVKLLLDKNADVTFRAEGGGTALHEAARNGHQAIVELLLAHGADTYVKNSTNKTPLDFAQMNGHKETIAVLKRYMGIQ